MQKDANLVELEKCCQTHILNYYFLAKFRFDTAENEPAKNLQNFAKFLQIQVDDPPDHLRRVLRPHDHVRRSGDLRGRPGGAAGRVNDRVRPEVGTLRST